MEPVHCAECERRQRRARFRIPLAFSLLANLVLFGFLAHWFFMVDQPPQDRPSPTEVITIARATPTPAPRPKPVQQTVVVRPTAQPHEVAQPVAHPQPHPVPIVATHVVPKHVMVARAPLPREEHVQAPIPAPAEKRMSQTQIAAVTQNLAGDIAQDKSAENPLRSSGAVSGTTQMKHFGYDASQNDATGIGHDGDCSPVKSWTQGGYNYYYLSCYVRATDGTADTEGIPWPVRFNPSDDPFAGTGKANMPVAMPLPGWHLTPGAYVSDGVRQYALEHGVTL